MSDDGPDRAVAGVVLAAGSSSRMEGRHKLLRPVRGRPLVRYAVDAALAAELAPVLVVLGARARQLEAALGGLPVEIVRNPGHRQGLSTSLAAARQALGGRASAAVLLLADEPEVRPEAIRRTIEAWRAGSELVRVRYDDRPGHPVLVDARRFSRLDSARGDRGLGEAFARGGPGVVEVRIEGRAPADIDTRSDYDALLARLRR